MPWVNRDERQAERRGGRCHPNCQRHEEYPDAGHRGI